MKFITLLFLGLGLSQASQLKCSSGEVTDPNGICIEPRFIEGCHQYESTMTCKKCDYKYKLNDNGLCQYQKVTYEPCCLSKGDGDKCKECNTGLKLDEDGNCRENSIVGCLEKSIEGKCVNCASDFYLENGGCEPGIKQCVAYLDEDKDGKTKETCTECKKNFSLVNNACLKNKILGCEQEIKHKCMKCLEPFKMKEDHCEIKNCLTYNDFGCTACECGFYLNPRNMCEEIQAGCIRYERGVCNACQSHFKLRGNTCVMEGCAQLEYLSCGKCTDEYDLIDGGCKLRNCAFWDNGVCHYCDVGYVTQGGKCTEDNNKPSSKQD